MNPIYVTTGGVPEYGYGKSGPEERRSVRVCGDATHAWLETAPSYFLSGDTPWVPELFPGMVTVERGRVTIASESLDPASARALELSYGLALRDARLHDPEQGRRYLTPHYAALDRAEAERLAAIDGGPVRVTEDVEIVHGTGDWALWSDGRITTALGLPRWARQIRGLSADAERLVSAARGSDSGPPACGYALLVRIAAIIATRELATGPSRGVYARDTIRELRVRLTDGTERTLYERTGGHFEGYEYELAETLAEVWPEGAAAIEGEGRGDG